jgi:hypothetical protein
MELIGRMDDIEAYWDYGEAPFRSGWIYSFLKCPNCRKPNLLRNWVESCVDSASFEDEHLYPKAAVVAAGLPPEVEREYQAAQKVKGVSPNAYAVLLGRLLELVCTDRGATKGDLNRRLAELASRGEIPERVVEMANALRELRHAGAHAWVGELTFEDVPVLESIAQAILEYVYAGPALLNEAGVQLGKIRDRQRAKLGREQENEVD